MAVEIEQPREVNPRPIGSMPATRLGDG